MTVLIKNRCFCKKGGKMRVLLVDDEDANRRLLIRFFDHFFPNSKIVQALDGVGARDRFVEKVFDLVITDYMMPKMDGLELAKFIKNSGRSSSVILISGIGDSRQLVLEVESLGFIFLEKPLSLEKLAKIISGFHIG